ncbi:non-ribosomal peptide synthetase [Nonomuraea fuscirosea]|uniref:non-ribosomal peptide synthetase n=1 Tax=Nonomuraea fuscirosea TaxID=1291556 RepID=UPI0033DB4E0B
MTNSVPGQAIPLQPRERRSASHELAQARQALLNLRARRAEQDRVAIRPVPRDRPLPLSFAQQRLWFLDQWFSNRPVYNSPFALRVRGVIDANVLGRALTMVVARHESLRTRYDAERGVPYQIIDPPPEAVDVPLVDVTGFPEEVRYERARDELTDLVRMSFDLARGPLLRTRLIRIAADDHLLGISIHHIATDGWSGGIFMRECVACYEAVLTGSTAGLPAIDVQYADYAVWQREQQSSAYLSRQLDYWRERLAGLPTLDLPTDRPRPAEWSFRGQTITLHLPEELRLGLGRLARAEQATMLTVTLAAFTALLSRHTGQDDIVVGSIFSGRTTAEIEPLIGFFANTLVLRTSTASDPTLSELIARTRDVVLGAHLNQDVTFNRLVDELAPSRDASRNPLFQVSFTLQHESQAEAAVGGLTIRSEPVQIGTARFDLAVHVTEFPGDGLELWAEFSTELFDPGRIRRLLDQYVHVLHQVVADPGVRLGRLELLTPGELAATIEQSRSPARPGVADRCLHELFERQADADSGRSACRFLGKTTTYGELDRHANRLAHLLRSSDGAVGPESVVGVLLDRGPDLPAALLGIMKAGGAYLPLDPQHPVDRIAYVLRDAGCRTVLTSRRLTGLLPGDVRAVVLDEPSVRHALDELPDDRLLATAGPRHAAYLIYTSGSTGRPKGVVVEHRQIVNFTLAVLEMFRLTPADRLLQFANPAFDTSAFDFYGAFAAGATLVQAPAVTLHDPAALTELMRAERVTVTDLPPSVLAELDPGALPELRALFVGMEPFPGELVNRWNVPGREFHNGYGPTEATVACVDHLCPDGRLDAMPPIGLPMAGCAAYVLDRSGNVVPPGVTGELYIGGDCVARGYHGRAALTAESFLPDPFGAPGSRMYRTGDLARRGEDGTLMFHGRADSQIKIRGLRIEPGEIETLLREHPQVEQALVTACTDGDGPRLVAYVVPGPGATPGSVPDVAELRGHLSRRLPPYMVPAAFEMLDSFPRNVNGKVDRARLPVPDPGAPAAAWIAPRTPIEARLAQAWAEVLGVEKPGVEDDFFALGGNSLKFAQIAARVREDFHVDVELRDLFSHPTIAGLAEVLEPPQDGHDGEGR